MSYLVAADIRRIKENCEVRFRRQDISFEQSPQ